MNLKQFLTFVIAFCLTSLSAFAQSSENSNPYAIFGGNPYIAGEPTDSESVKVFVVDNIDEGSPVARLEHNTETGVIILFDADGNVIGRKQLAKGERAWPTIDPKAEKYYGTSPYVFTLNNPVKYIDLDGEAVYMLFYTTNDKMFKAAAETRRQEIESMKSFNPEKDKVVMMGFKDVGQLESLTKWAVDTYSADYGQTAEAGIWSHAGWDGPIGDIPTSGKYVLSNWQMSIEGWSNIDFNWASEGANMSFYGCNTGNDIYKNEWIGAFARQISNLTNFEGVDVWGQQTSSFPSSSPYIRATNLARTIGYGFGIGSTYMVGGNPDQGWRSHWFVPGTYPRANPMNIYKNGQFSHSAFQNR